MKRNDKIMNCLCLNLFWQQMYNFADNISNNWYDTLFIYKVNIPAIVAQLLAC